MINIEFHVFLARRATTALHGLGYDYTLELIVFLKCIMKAM